MTKGLINQKYAEEYEYMVSSSHGNRSRSKSIKKPSVTGTVPLNGNQK